jgi:hypothetical protein
MTGRAAELMARLRAAMEVEAWVLARYEDEYGFPEVYLLWAEEASDRLKGRIDALAEVYPEEFDDATAAELHADMADAWERVSPWREPRRMRARHALMAAPKAA